MEDCGFNINYWNMNSIDEFNTLQSAASFGDNLQQCQTNIPNFNLKNNSSNHPYTIIDRPHKQLKPNTWVNHSSQSGLFPGNMSATNSNYANQTGFLKPKNEEAFCSKSITNMVSSDMLTCQGLVGNQNYVFKPCKGGKRISPSGNGISHTQDHILAERKRREKLSQRFIALSAIVPGLKKVYLILSFLHKFRPPLVTCFY